MVSILLKLFAVQLSLLNFCDKQMLLSDYNPCTQNVIIIGIEMNERSLYGGRLIDESLWHMLVDR